MDGAALVLFIISLIMFVVSLYFVYSKQPVSNQGPQTSSGWPLPTGSMIGAQCPVGCTCFPNADATLPTGTPAQVCAYLSDDVMFRCPSQCCQPSCVP